MSRKIEPESKSQTFSSKSLSVLSALKDKDREEVEQRLDWFANAKGADFKRKVVATVLTRPQRHLIHLSKHHNNIELRLYGVISRQRTGLRVYAIFNQASALKWLRGMGR